jgi:four helix bundle protein
LALVRPIHDLVKSFPEFKDRDLVQQMRRASKSVPANIVEGFSRRRSAKDFKLYLAYAMGSANEVTRTSEVAGELGYASPHERTSLADDYRIICRQLNKLVQNWR